eukprot:4615381-Pyramimonas_sp.AAC.1
MAMDLPHSRARPRLRRTAAMSSAVSARRPEPSKLESRTQCAARRCLKLALSTADILSQNG